MKSEKVLISGGAGFIGSHLANTLLTKRYEVLVVDNLSKGREKNLDHGVKLIKEDIRGLKFTNIIKKYKPDIFYHLAAQSSLQASIHNPKQDLATNFIPIIKILDTLKKIDCKKLVFASSAAVYQESTGRPLKETDIVLPSTPYGISKLACENYIKYFHKVSNLPFTILRFSNVYGPNQDDSSEGGVVSIFVKNNIDDKKSIIYGDGNQTRDFIFVTDVVSALILSKTKNLIGTYNVSTNKETSINQLYMQILSKLKKTHKPVFKKPNIFEVKKSKLNFHAFKMKSGWKPIISLPVGLDKTIVNLK